ncbi:uncharacterized protein LOC110806368 isoform X2 [Carica papaya]|uniref:uncharacterized protein LOC110806368 isoform X2 n=1 Tax=Carica papaya TaxID=3649 RepID=UPI000B8C8319|nr:uncharacterized protein LOC110806368 isoform X2 [Carica papaya]
MEYIYIMLMQYSLTKISFKKTKCFSLFSLEGACLHYFHAAENDVQIKNVVRNSCLGDEACGGMYRANTMASAIVSSFQVQHLFLEGDESMISAISKDHLSFKAFDRKWFCGRLEPTKQKIMVVYMCNWGKLIFRLLLSCFMAKW